VYASTVQPSIQDLPTNSNTRATRQRTASRYKQLAGHDESTPASETAALTAQYTETAISRGLRCGETLGSREVRYTVLEKSRIKDTLHAHALRFDRAVIDNSSSNSDGTIGALLVVEWVVQLVLEEVLWIMMFLFE
jgi:hypothetical protein